MTLHAAAIEKIWLGRDFWLSSGHHLLDRDQAGGLIVTDDFLRAYLARPELIPTQRSCAVERTLHAALLAEPRRAIEAGIVEEIADPDARENWQTMLAFRDRLLRHPTLESAYLALVRGGMGGTPPLFLNQLVHVILRNILDGCPDPHMLRAAELFFRPQRLTIHSGSLITADAEHIASARTQPASPLAMMLAQPADDIDVLTDDNADGYWRRSDRFDMALDLTAGRRGVEAIGQVIQRWIGHFLSIEVDIQSVTALEDVRLCWYVGLDAEGTRIGDGLWRDETPGTSTQLRIAALFQLRFRDNQVVLDRARGEPVYLIMGMTPDMTLRLKPQNLLSGLPLLTEGAAQ
jgi:hypothetical protein